MIQTAKKIKIHRMKKVAFCVGSFTYGTSTEYSLVWFAGKARLLVQVYLRWGNTVLKGSTMAIYTGITI